MMLAKRSCGLLSVILFALCLSVPAMAQQVIVPPGSVIVQPGAGGETGLGGGNAIIGMLVLSNGRRLEQRVSVRLQTMTKGDRVALSDEYGKFTFQGLVPGEYTIVIDKEKEYEPFRQLVSIMQPRGTPPQAYNLSIRLTIKPGTEGKPGVVDVSTAGASKRALELYNKAIELEKTGDRPGAIEQLKSVVTEFPGFMLAYNELGVQYMKMSELQRSDDAFISALKIDPAAYMPLTNRGIVLVMMKRYAEAEPLLREVVKMKDDQGVGHYFLGQSLANLGKFIEAEKELLLAVRFGGDQMKEAHRLLAIIYGYSGDKKASADELEIYLRLAPNTPDAEQLRHRILQLKGLEATPPPAQPKPTP